MNFTLDDSSPQLIYSADWELQPANDPSLSSFFQSTYHAALEPKASVNLTFTGTAVYIYGSKGPGHAKFSVQCDGVIANVDASAAQTRFQQLLFSYTFPNSTSSAHFVALVTQPGTNGNWLDIDYVTFAQDAQSSSAALQFPSSRTLQAPWFSESQSTGASQTSGAVIAGSSASAGADAVSTTTSARNNSMLITSIILGCLLGCLALAVLLYFLLHRHKAKKGTRFRYGITHAGSTASIVEERKPWLPWSHLRSASSLSSTPSGTSASGSQSMSEAASTRSSAIVPPRPAFGILSGVLSPNPSPKPKNDADSMKTNFLQV
ncbi:hypothetical protein EVG20_g8523 [Dentipellis fragilis]|uniref:Uncharacterized protein n=1 Tax=Dentipellis fragilis TaxID=205917 RepID=A0A4Y9Y633_9AGAM|nr:hypothetical protein EVG20_g8523 [Dentipellis fragilis]